MMNIKINDTVDINNVDEKRECMKKIEYDFKILHWLDVQFNVLLNLISILNGIELDEYTIIARVAYFNTINDRLNKYIKHILHVYTNKMYTISTEDKKILTETVRSANNIINKLTLFINENTKEVIGMDELYYIYDTIRFSICLILDYKIINIINKSREIRKLDKVDRLENYRLDRLDNYNIELISVDNLTYKIILPHRLDDLYEKHYFDEMLLGFNTKRRSKNNIKNILAIKLKYKLVNVAQLLSNNFINVDVLNNDNKPITLHVSIIV